MESTVSTSDNFEKPDRRKFLNMILGASLTGWLVSVVYPILAYMSPPRQADVEVTSVDVGKLSEIEKGSGRILRFGSRPVLFIRPEEGEMRAFSATCTHLDCTVQYRNDMGIIWCACHNGQYDLSGRNISGPPPRPLEEYRVVVQGENVLITKKA